MKMPHVALTPLLGLVALVLFASAGTVCAAEPPPDVVEPTKEMRAKMAAMHERMAACLRSDKDVATCRNEMHSRCRAEMGEEGCQMMRMNGAERMRKRRMDRPSDANAE